MKIPRKATHHQGLMQILKFNHGDLQANREGILSKAQRHRILARTYRHTWIGLLIALVLNGLVVLRYAAEADSSAPPFLVVTLIIASPWMLGVIIYFPVRTLWYLWRPLIEINEGLLTREYDQRNRSVPTLFMPNKAFVVSHSVYDAFKDGQTYTLYSVYGLNELLSAESHGINLTQPKNRKSYMMQKRLPLR